MWLQYTKNTFEIILQLFSGQRHFSGTLTTPSKKYLNLNSRNLVEWDAFVALFSKVKAA
jgi:iron complex outermembrane receptor protein